MSKFILLREYTPADDIGEGEREELFDVAARVVLDSGEEVLAVTPSAYILLNYITGRYIQRETLGGLLHTALNSYQLALAILDAVVELPEETAVSVFADKSAPPVLYNSIEEYTEPFEFVLRVAELAAKFTPCRCAKEYPDLLVSLVPERLVESLLVYDPEAAPWLCSSGGPAVRVRGRCYAVPVQWR